MLSRGLGSRAERLSGDVAEEPKLSDGDPETVSGEVGPTCSASWSCVSPDRINDVLRRSIEA